MISSIYYNTKFYYIDMPLKTSPWNFFFLFFSFYGNCEKMKVIWLYFPTYWRFYREIIKTKNKQKSCGKKTLLSPALRISTSPTCRVRSSSTWRKSTENSPHKHSVPMPAGSLVECKCSYTASVWGKISKRKLLAGSELCSWRVESCWSFGNSADFLQHLY